MTTTRTKLQHLTAMLAVCYAGKIATHGRVHLCCNGGKLTLASDKSAELRVSGKLVAVWGWLRFDTYQSATGFGEWQALEVVGQFLTRTITKHKLEKLN